MERLFDLNEFLMQVTARRKIVFLCVLLGALIWAGIGTGPSAAALLRGGAAPGPAESAEDRMPWLYKARRTVYLPGEAPDGSSPAADALTALAGNEELLRGLLEARRAEIEADYRDLQRKMVERNYRTKSVYAETFADFRFFAAFEAESPNPRTVILSYTGGNRELAERVADDFARALCRRAEAVLGPFARHIDVSVPKVTLPEPAGGLIPTVVSGEAPAAPGPAAVVKSGVKHAFFGALAGLAAALCLIFAAELRVPRIWTAGDLGELSPAPVLTLCRGAAGDRWIRRLWPDRDGEEPRRAAAAADAKIAAKLPNARRILLCGDLPAEEKWLEYLNSKGRILYEAAADFSSPENLAKLAACDAAVMAVQRGRTCRERLRRDLADSALLGKDVAGFVLFV